MVKWHTRMAKNHVTSVMRVRLSPSAPVKPIYFMYSRNRRTRLLYRILDDVLQLYVKEDRKWHDQPKGELSWLHQEKCEEISEEDVFLRLL